MVCELYHNKAAKETNKNRTNRSMSEGPNLVTWFFTAPILSHPGTSRKCSSTWWGIMPLTGRDWGQEEKGTTEDEMAGWHHRLNGHEFE